MRFSSFDDLLSRQALAFGDAAALLYGEREPKRCSYSELYERVSRQAEAFRALHKSCLGVLADGSFDCVIAIFAAVKAGMQVVLLDDALSDELLLRLVSDTDIDQLYGDPDLCEALSPALTGGVTDGAHRILFFTSGTTDRSKAVVLTEQSLMASAYNGGALLPLTPKDTLLCMLPLAHVFGFVCGLLWGLSCGATVALGRGPRHYFDDCTFFRPTALSAVPLLWGFLLKYKAINPELKLLLIGAGDCKKPLLDAAQSLGIRVSFGYGLTETSSGVALSLGDDPYAMTVCPDDRITIADDDEILIESPTCLMQGYYKNPQDTAAAVPNGVLHTGDLGRFDENGLLHITGRKKEMLVLPDGTKLFLPEYERDCAAVLHTEELCIVLSKEVPTLVLGNMPQGDARDILARLEPVLRDRPRGQQLKNVLFTAEPLPRTATGKIKRWAIQREGNSI
ncbi:MAG: AMP-binding protein [Clostridia bacterium]|nr:AMP-binding protein [Clostridia bacterium]